MARKRQKRKKSPILEYRRLPMEKLRQRIQESCEDGNIRAAIDMAKEYRRRDPCSATAELLGETYLRRAHQLVEKKLHREAMAVLGNALALGQGSVELLLLAFECGLRSGEYESALGVLRRLRDPADQAWAACRLADEAVVHGDELGRLCDAAVRDDAARIRRAFDAFEQGDDRAVAAELRPIGLRNPFARWKWLLRGLVAYVRGDDAGAGASWSRAAGAAEATRIGGEEGARRDSRTSGSATDHRRNAWATRGTSGPSGCDNGRAGQLARLLLSALADERSIGDELPQCDFHRRDGGATGGGTVGGRVGGQGRPPHCGAARAKLLRSLGNPRVGLLEQIKDSLARDRHTEAFDRCAELLAAVPVEDRESYAVRLGRAMCGAFALELSTARQFRRVLGAMPEDPRFSRLIAVQLEQEAPDEALPAWRRYLGELHLVRVIPSHVRARARALIWRRMGDLAKDAFGDGPGPFGFHDARYVGTSGLDAATCYGKSIKCYADDLRTHESLVDALRCAGDMKGAQRAAEMLLERWPNHVESLLFLGRQCFERDAFRKALKLFDRAREAEPFNAEVRSEAQTCLLFSARRRLERGNLGLARKDYQHAETFCDPNGGGTSAFFYCKWAAMEWRAGKAADAEALFERAEASREDPLLLYYQLSIELDRAQAPADVQDRFEKLLEAEWRNKPTGANAAAAAKLAFAHDELRVCYGRREDHRAALADYLHRASKKAVFSEDQLLAVCRYLDTDGNGRLLETYAKWGADQFGGNYIFPLLLGRSQARKGKRRLPRATRKLLVRAEEQARQAGDLDAADEMATLRSGGSMDGFDGIASVVRALVKAAEKGELPSLLDDLPVDPFPKRPPRRRTRRRRNDAAQLSLFDDLFAPEAEAE